MNVLTSEEPPNPLVLTTRRTLAHPTSDHYLHHRFFECNYGELWTPWDTVFGTFRDRLEPGSVASPDAKATLAGAPENPLFLLLGLGVPAFAVAAVCNLVPGAPFLFADHPRAVAALVAVGPIATAALLHFLSAKTTAATWQLMMAPFHGDGPGVQALHLGFGGGLLCVLPVYALVATALLPPGEAPTCALRAGLC